MLGWAIGFLLAALAAGVLAFGLLETDFADASMDLFWSFVALFGAALSFAVVGGKYATPFRASGRAFARLAFVGLVALLGYAWVDRNWTGERAQAVVAPDDGQFTERAATPPAAYAGEVEHSVGEATNVSGEDIAAPDQDGGEAADVETAPNAPN